MIEASELLPVPTSTLPVYVKGDSMPLVRTHALAYVSKPPSTITSSWSVMDFLLDKEVTSTEVKM